MAIPTVTETLKLPATVAAAHTKVRVRLVASLTGEAVGFAFADDATIVGQSEPVPDPVTGVWSLPMMPNERITPANTVYERVLTAPKRPSAVDYFTVPDVVGPVRVEDNITTLPGALADPGTLLALLGADLDGGTPSSVFAGSLDAGGP